MLAQIIIQSLKNKFLVMLVFLGLGLMGFRALDKIPLDAIPDLTDVQVIIKTSYPGQASEIVEQQVTYPLSTWLLSVAKVKAVRGWSFFGDSYVYVIFEDGTDPYWARTRVQEYLSRAETILPDAAKPSMGPDASGVGWIFQYVLKDTTNSRDLSEMRELQDWFLKFELQSVPGVSEVATVGGMEKTYQVVLDPLKLMQYGLTIAQVRSAIHNANSEQGGSVMEIAEAEYMIRGRGYLSTLDDFDNIALGIVNDEGMPLTLKHVATIKTGPQLRRGIADLNGLGEVVGGIVIMRDGENALTTINHVKAKIAQLSSALPDGVEFEVVYDRSKLITASVDNLQSKILIEMAVVAVVCFAFLLHIRSTLVVVLSIPFSLLIGFLAMQWSGLNANIMSLGGIAIAVGALVDSAIVMVENVNRHLLNHQKRTGIQPSNREKYKIIETAATEVGPVLFISLLIITIGFFPVFALEGQEGKLFTPLALTKTFVMAATALLSVTLVPVLMSLLIKGQIPDETRNPLNAILIRGYTPFINFALASPKLVMFIGGVVAVSMVYPLMKMDSEFMPDLYEGDLLYMPSTLPGVSIAEAGSILQKTDQLIKTVPEVESVFGKVGRADTATDPAPLTMLETTIQLKPVEQWRAGMTLEKIIAELESKVKLPGVTNTWVQPIKTRIDMLSTGVKTQLGIKISGESLTELTALGEQIEGLLNQLESTGSVYAERTQSGRYIDIEPNRVEAAKYGLMISDIQDVVKFALGGANISEVVDGRTRFPINLRYPRVYRDNIDALETVPFLTPTGAWVTLGQVASIEVKDGPAVIKSENGLMSAWVFISVTPDVAISDYVDEASALLASNIDLPERYTYTFTGQYEHIERLEKKLLEVIPLTVLVIFVLLYIAFRSSAQALLVLCTLPIAISGALWFVYFCGYPISGAVVVGMIALGGVAAEFGVVITLYLNQARAEQSNLVEAVREGALLRIRPKAMTVFTIVAGLIPIMFSMGSGDQIMQKIAAPMIGGMLVSPIMSMLVIPAGYLVLYRYKQRKLEE
ncbi:efflux RND transporter permease subunit [Pseudoalteromonas sp. McH1-7]|uniref:efflux RND transporter permease subunit n=1 Tax=Pseudoalteromonas sp. McH1-7 TaxID=2745574 RepID=UPI00159264B8|nr:CusA/CzcA family heavy metal efflux RND transporter [Pseudoalteromonas sp. McH1-7]NUZ10526.1 efflux RND transporter permease subunit [Pseudoalteromonas sp. McH1-7]